MNYKKNKKNQLLISSVVFLLAIFLVVNPGNISTYINDNQSEIKDINSEEICSEILSALIDNTGEALNGDPNWECYELTCENIKKIGLKNCNDLVYYNLYDNQKFGCLAYGTKIRINKYENKNIEDIKVGDNIVSYDIKHDKIVNTKVIAVNSYISDGVYSINDGLIKITEDHPILIKNNFGKKIWCSVDPMKSEIYYNYRDVSKLKIGYDILSIKRGWVEIDSIDFEPNKVKVVGLQVENKNHNFIANNIVVSNAFYTLNGYVEGVQSLDIENYIILSEDKIDAFYDLYNQDYQLLRNLLNVPLKYNFKITLQYGSNSPVTVGSSIDYSYSDYYAFKKQNVLVLPSGATDLSSLSYGYIMVEVFYA